MKRNVANLLLLIIFQILSLSGQARDLYWIGGSGYFNDITNWSDQPGGKTSTAAHPPDRGDNVYFDKHSFPEPNAEVIITDVARCLNMYWGSDVKNMPTLKTDDNPAHYLVIYGGVQFNDRMVIDLDRPLYFRANTLGNVIDFGGNAFNGDCYFENNGGWRIVSDLNLLDNSIYFNQGTISLEANLTCGKFISANSVSRELYLNASTINLQKTGETVLSLNADNLNLYPGTSKIIVAANNSAISIQGSKRIELYDILFSGDNGGLENSTILSSFNDVVFEKNGSLQGENDFQKLKFTEGNNYTIRNGTQKIKTSFEALGQCYAYITITGEVTGSNISAEAVNLDYLKVKNINASGTAVNFAAKNSYDLGGNTNWTFIAPSSDTYTWNGGAGDGKWGTPANWDSGCVPSRNNDVVIPAGFIVEVDVPAECKSLDVDDNSTFDGANNIEIYGSLTAGSCTWNFSGEVQFRGKTVNTIEINSSFIGPVIFDGDADWTLTTDISVLNVIELVSGNVIANGNNIVTDQFVSSSTFFRTLNIANSNIDITDGVAKAWNVSGNNFTIISGNSEIKLTTVGAEFYNNSSDYIAYGQVSFNPLSGQVLLTNEGSAQPSFESVVFNGNARIAGDHQYDQLVFTKGKEYLFAPGGKQKISVADGLVAHGTCSDYITFKGDGGIAYFDCDVASTDLFRLRIEDVNVIGGIGSLTAKESIGISGYDGWIFPDDLFGDTVFWTGKVDNNWFNAENWSRGCLPNRKDVVVFDDSKVLGSYEVNISIPGNSAECLDMKWTNANLMSFTGDQPICIFGSLDFSGMDASNFVYSGDFYFKSVDPETINTVPVALLSDLFFAGTEQDDGSWQAGSWTLSSELNTTGVIHLERGSLLTDNHDVAAASFVSNFGVDKPRELILGSSTFRLERFEISPEAFTFDAGTSELIFTTSGHLIISKGPDPVAFYNVTYESANGNAYLDNHSDNVSFNNLVLNGNTYFRKTNPSKINFTAESIQLEVGKTYVFESRQTYILGDIVANGACEGTIDITGSHAYQAIFQAKTGVTNITVNSVNILNVKAEPADVFVAKKSINLGGADGWKFEDEPGGTNLYWVGGTGNWDDPAHWSTVSGIKTGGCVPTAKDNVFFDDGSFTDTEQTVYTGGSDIRCRTMNWTGSEAARPHFEMGTTDITGVYIYGSFILNSSVQVDLSPMVNFYFRATEVQEINTFGYVFPNIVEFDGNGGEWNLLDDMIIEGDCFIRYGKLVTGGHDLECKSITSTDPTEGVNSRGLDIRNSQVRITGREDDLGRSIYINLADAYTDLGFEFLSDNSTVTFTNNAEVYIRGTNTQSINFNKIVFEEEGELDTGFSGVSFYVGYLQFLANGVINGKGENKFGTLDLGRGFDFTFQNGETYEMDHLLVEGSCFAPISIHSKEAGKQTTILASNDVNGDFLQLKDIAGDASKGATYTATNSFNLGNVDGWAIDGAVAPIALYWTGKGLDDSWHNHENWSRSADGSEEGCVPTLNDDVFFTANSFLGSKVVELLTDGQCHSMTWLDDVDPGADFSVNAKLRLGGFMDLTEGMSLSMRGVFDFVGDGLTGDKIVDFANKSMDGDIIFNGDDQSWVWNSELITSGDLYLESGSVNTSGNDFTIRKFNSLSLSNFDAVRKFDMTGSIATVSSDQLLGWNMIVNTNGGLNFIGTDSRIIFENGGGIYCKADTDVNFGAVQFFNNGVIKLDSPAGTGEGFFATVQFFEQGQIYGDNTFENLEFTLGYENNIIESGKTVTVIHDLTMEGVRCSYIFLRSSSPGNKAFLHKPGGVFDKIFNASLTDISGSSGTGGLHKVHFKYDRINSEGFVLEPGTSGEDNPPSFEDSFDQPREEWCSDVAVLDHVKNFPINNLTTFQWYYSADGTAGTYTPLPGETNAVIEVSVTGFYLVDVIYGLSNDINPCIIKSVIEVELGTKSMVSLEITANNVKCFGEGNGRIVAKVKENQYPDYQFTWVDEAGNDFTASTTTNKTNRKSTALNLSPGKYKITVADGKNCDFDTLVNVFDAYKLLINDITTKDLTCYTVPEGEISIDAAGGTGNLSYYLDDKVQTGENITGLYSGDYIVFVQDENSCKTAEEAVMLNSNPEIVVDLNGRDLLCYNDNNGQFMPNVTGGVPDYTYSWTGPAGFTATSDKLTGLTGGNYELTLTDAVNCVATISQELQEPEELTTNELTIEDANCHGENSGEIFVEAKNGTPTYQYYLNGSESVTGIFSNLPPNDYTLRIVDANSCVFEKNLTVSNPGKIGFLVEDIVLPTCENSTDGIIHITPYGGNSGYEFSWSGPNDFRSYKQNIEDVVAGEYHLLITDKKNCSVKEKVDLSLGLGMQLGVVVKQHLTSAGANDGILEVEVLEGTLPYHFTVTGPGHTSVSPDDFDEHSLLIENLAGGVYTVVATDASGCSSITKSAIIEEPGRVFAFIEEVQAVGCATNPVGELRARVEGGDGNHTFSWTGPGGYTNTGEVITNLSPGTYTLTASSAGQSAVVTYDLSAPEPLLASIASVKNVSCNNAANGEIELDVNFGSADYTIEWTKGAGYLSSAKHILDLEPGTYNYTVTSEYGCSVSGSQEITEPDPLSLTVTPVDISIAGQHDGQLSASVTGGTSPYFFLVSGPKGYSFPEPGNITGSISINGLGKGVYEVVVLDANQCRIEDSKKVHEPEILLVFTTSCTDVTCPKGSDGAITIGVLGESDPANLSYSWTGDNHFRSTDKDVSGLKAGRYTITVHDSAGDPGYEEQSLQVIVNEPEPLVAEIWKKDISCYGMNDGYINVHPQGGTPEYKFLWGGTGTIPTNEDQQGLSEGSYSVQITDSEGCKSEVVNINILEPAEITASIIESSEPTCYGYNDGWIKMEIVNGTEPYIVNWDNYGSISQNIFNLKKKNYSFTVEDINGCKTTGRMNLNEPDSLIAEVNDYLDIDCFGMNTGKAIVDITGGTPNYTISWSNGQDTEEATGLSIGHYEVSVVDANGCSDISSVELVQPEQLKMEVEAIRPATERSNDGAISINITGGVKDYTIDWVDQALNSYSGLTIEDLERGTYKISVTDANKCPLDSLVVLEPLYENRIKIPKAFTPNNDGYNDYWDIDRIEYVQQLKIVIYDRWGKTIYKFSGTGNEYRGDPWKGNDGNTKLPIGSYYYAVELDDDKPLMGTVTILR